MAAYKTWADLSHVSCTEGADSHNGTELLDEVDGIRRRGENGVCTAAQHDAQNDTGTTAAWLDFETALEVLRSSFNGEMKRTQAFYEDRMIRDAVERKALVTGLMEENARLIQERTTLEEANLRLTARVDQLERQQLLNQQPKQEYHRLPSPIMANNKSASSFTPERRDGLTEPQYKYERERQRRQSNKSNSGSSVRAMHSSSFHVGSVASSQDTAASPFIDLQAQKHQQQKQPSPYTPPRVPAIDSKRQHHTALLAEIDRSLTGPAPSSASQSGFAMPVSSTVPVTLVAAPSPAALSPSLGTLNTSANSLARSGRNFFRDARMFLEQPAFDQLLLSMKRLNLGQQTRQETIEVARVLFEPKGGDLFLTFQELLQGQMVQDNM